MDLQTYVMSLGLSPAESRRIDCPVCGHRKTFSVTYNGWQYLWHCFHANCHTGGKSDYQLTRGNAAQVLNFKKPSTQSSDFIKPASWVKPTAACWDYFKSVHTDTRYPDVYHDVKQNRAVYAVRDSNNRLVDGVGRTLEGARPKWYRYGNYGGGFMCGSSRVAVVVEDVPSAISVSDWVTGYALMGTSLRDDHVVELAKFDRVIVALDRDATLHALTLVRALSTVVRSGMLMLDKDLKSLGEIERERTIRDALS
jgi:hypothetical protein